MTARAEMSITLQEAEPEPFGSSGMSVALIGPNDAHRKIVAKALTGSDAGKVREFINYPGQFTDLPRIVGQSYDVVMLDVDSDQSYALALIENIAAIGRARVIAYSIRSNPDLQESCLLAGAQDFLPLPTEDDEELWRVSPTIVEDAAESGEADVRPSEEQSFPEKIIEKHTTAAKAVEAPSPLPPNNVRQAEPDAYDFTEWDAKFLRRARPEGVGAAEKKPQPALAPEASAKSKSKLKLVEVLSPAVEALPPSVEALPPAPENFLLEAETLPPVVENLLPAVEDLSPAVEALPPAVETPRPAPENPLLEVESLPPVVENLPLAVEGASPAVEALSPLVEAPRPAEESLPPAAESLPTAAEVLSPLVEGLPPAVESFPLVAESFLPAVEAPPFTAESLHPVAKSLLPAVEALPPVVQNLPAAPESLPRAAENLPRSVESRSPAVETRPRKIARTLLPIDWTADEPIPVSKTNEVSKKDEPVLVSKKAEPLPFGQDEAYTSDYEADDGEGVHRNWMKMVLIPAGLSLVAGLLVFVLGPPIRDFLEAAFPVQSAALQAGSTGTTPNVPRRTPGSWRTIFESRGENSNKERPTPQVPSEIMEAQLTAPPRIPIAAKKPAPLEEPPAELVPAAFDSGGSIPGTVFGGKSPVKVVPAVSAISAGVAEGLLIHRTTPVYPVFARENNMGGTVTLSATITKTGAIDGLHVISGPAVFRQPAVDAVNTWRYKPYTLDNQPVNVQTTISVVFNAGAH
jgi:TonB family protein